jgi:hypothetical protein
MSAQDRRPAPRAVGVVHVGARAIVVRKDPAALADAIRAARRKAADDGSTATATPPETPDATPEGEHRAQGGQR